MVTCYNQFMEPTKELIEQLEREDIDQARRMTASQKLRAGGDLFDDACRWTLAGIRRDHPGIGDAEAMAELRRRLEKSKRMEQRL